MFEWYGRDDPEAILLAALSGVFCGVGLAVLISFVFWLVRVAA